MNPANCTATAHVTIRTVMVVISVKISVPIVSLITNRWEREIRCLANTKKAVAIVMMPRPPMNIITKIVNWPGRLQKVEVSTVTSPVTVAAEVAVNNASIKGVKSSEVVENGISKRMVPIIINPKNMYNNIRGEAKILGCDLLLVLEIRTV